MAFNLWDQMRWTEQMVLAGTPLAGTVGAPSDPGGLPGLSNIRAYRYNSVTREFEGNTIITSSEVQHSYNDGLYETITPANGVIFYIRADGGIVYYGDNGLPRMATQDMIWNPNFTTNPTSEDDDEAPDGGDSGAQSTHEGTVFINLGSHALFVTATFATTGNDVITKGGFVYGEGGHDSLIGSSGADHLNGGDGNDWLDGGAGGDLLDGGAGWDVVSYLLSSTSGVVVNLTTNENSGAATGDRLLNIELVEGTNYGDTITGVLREGGHGVELSGKGGNDYLIGKEGADRLYGGDDNDWMFGGQGADTIDGGNGWDVASYLGMSSGINVNLTTNENGGAAQGDQVLNVEVLQGTDYNDILTGVDRGGGIGVQLYGEGGADNLTGKGGGDYLYGGSGADWLDGGWGSDILVGGSGTDTFAFTAALGSGNVDDIRDFTVSDNDKIVLSRHVFTSVGLGVLSSAAFTAGVGATTAEHRIIYNQATGDLSYDADGSGALAAVKFAAMSAAGAQLSASNFYVM
ncbi:calcium-binding protein [Microvirga sp. 17 mud 1-3]|uniref:calcium-binding protein n=1 Tax=Microvirga sp. 17 mud 1-3 TaxID=2082949 RepID=UPI0013A5B427|nr:calcium-binding protein [Microvirga sp. 17 mud 1-3]